MRFIILLLMTVPFICFSQVRTYDGLNIYLEELGEGDTTLLFIHGWNLDHTFWQAQADEFSADFRVVVPDLPGYGQSGKNRAEWSMKNYGRDIRSVIDQLDLQNVILVAHSMGGTIALEAMMTDPSRVIGIIGVDNFKDVGAAPDSLMQVEMEQFYAYLEENYSENVKQAAAGFMFHPESPAGPKEIILETYASANPEIAIPVVRSAFSDSVHEAEQLQRIDVPFALISSTNIPFNEQMFLSHFSGWFRNYEVQGTGHFPMFERPEAFNDALKNALADMFRR